MSPSSALPSWEGSNLVVFPRADTAMPRAATTTRTMRPVQSQNFRLFLRCVAKGCSHIFLVSEASRSVVTQEAAERFHRRGRKLLQGHAELLPAPILDVRGEEGNSYFGECYLLNFMRILRGTVYAYLRRTPRTLPWMLTLAAGA